MRIGNQTNCHVPSRVPFEFALRQGFDAFEWFSDKGRAGWCEADETPAARSELRRLGEGAGLLYSVHAPFAADPVTSSGAAAIRESVRFAGDVGGGVVNLHLFPEHPARVFAESLGPLLEDARAAGVRLSLENTPACSPDHFNAAFGVLSAMPEAVGTVGMCLDTGHANLFAGTRHHFTRYVDLLGDHVPIVHWHAHENWGDRDSHLTLFTGPAATDDSGVRRILSQLAARGFAGSVVLEQWPEPAELLVRARGRLLGLWAECRAGRP